jgi:transcription initiation factor TFIID subunit TAF12
MASTRRYDLVSHNIFRKEFISSDSPIGVSFTPDDDTLTTKNSAYEE